jgi:signal transduction histidine kinase
MTKDFNGQIQRIKLVPQELGRVLLNLYNNAFYAANEKDKLHQHDYEPAVHIRTRQSGQFLEIEVEDNGQGISSNHGQDFQPFYDQALWPGTGLDYPEL